LFVKGVLISGGRFFHSELACADFKSVFQNLLNSFQNLLCHAELVSESPEFNSWFHMSCWTCFSISFIVSIIFLLTTNSQMIQSN